MKHKRTENEEDIIHQSAIKNFNDDYSWEYNLDRVVRWENEISKQEGYKLVKND